MVSCYTLLTTRGNSGAFESGTGQDGTQPSQTLVMQSAFLQTSCQEVHDCIGVKRIALLLARADCLDQAINAGTSSVSSSMRTGGLSLACPGEVTLFT